MIQVKQVVVVGVLAEQRDAPGAKAVFRRGMKAMAKDWHRLFLPRHFQSGAKRRYGYQERKRKYAQRKQRRGLPPLVFSGRARSHARALFRVTGSAKTVRGKFFLPHYFRMKPMRAGQPSLGEELTRTTRHERSRLAIRFKARVEAGLRKIKTRKVVKL